MDYYMESIILYRIDSGAVLAHHPISVVTQLPILMLATIISLCSHIAYVIITYVIVRCYCIQYNLYVCMYPTIESRYLTCLGKNPSIKVVSAK